MQLGLVFSALALSSCSGISGTADAGARPDTGSSDAGSADVGITADVGASDAGSADVGATLACLTENDCQSGEYCKLALQACPDGDLSRVTSGSCATAPCGGDCHQRACQTHDECAPDEMCESVAPGQSCAQGTCCLKAGRCAMIPNCPDGCRAVWPAHTMCFACVCPTCPATDAGAATDASGPSTPDAGPGPECERNDQCAQGLFCQFKYAADQFHCGSPKCGDPQGGCWCGFCSPPSDSIVHCLGGSPAEGDPCDPVEMKDHVCRFGSCVGFCLPECECAADSRWSCHPSACNDYCGPRPDGGVGCEPCGSPPMCVKGCGVF